MNRQDAKKRQGKQTQKREYPSGSWAKGLHPYFPVLGVLGVLAVQDLFFLRFSAVISI
jgi:hypothetical protein